MTTATDIDSLVFQARFAARSKRDPLLKSARAFEEWLRVIPLDGPDLRIVSLGSKRSLIPVDVFASEARGVMFGSWHGYTSSAIWGARPENYAAGSGSSLYLPPRTACDLRSGYAQINPRPILWVGGDLIHVAAIDTLANCLVVGIPDEFAIAEMLTLRGPTMTTLTAQPVHVVLEVTDSRVSMTHVGLADAVCDVVERIARCPVVRGNIAVHAATTKAGLQALVSDAFRLVTLAATPRGQWLE